MSAFFDQANNTCGLMDSRKGSVADVPSPVCHSLNQGRNFEPGGWSCCKVLSSVQGVWHDRKSKGVDFKVDTDRLARAQRFPRRVARVRC